MKMQIWKVYISDGWMGAIHGQLYPIYEGYIPELELTINHLTSFIHHPEDGENTRYKKRDLETRMENEPLPSVVPRPELMCEVELSPEQISDAKIIASEDSPEDRLRQVIASLLKKQNLETSDYED